MAIFGLAGVRWWTWVFQLATHASCDLILLGYIVFELIVKLRRLIFVIVLLARSASGLGRL